MKEKATKIYNSEKRNMAINSINNYLSQLQQHYDLSNRELSDIIKCVKSKYNFKTFTDIWKRFLGFNKVKK
jgi:hypothetical protein